MKNRSSRITLIFLAISLFLALICHKLLISYSSIENISYYNFLIDLGFVITAGITLKYILTKNEKNYNSFVEKLQVNNEEPQQAKEKYDIVAKATSDTIWDWNIQNDGFSWNKGIQGIFGYNKEEVGKTSKWWFDKIHPEDSINMSIKLYSFLEEKSEKWQYEYRFKCKNGRYKYVLDRGFIVKDEYGKAIRMIGAIQDVTKQKEEEQRLRLLETVVTQTKDSVIITESKKASKSIPRIVFVNPAFTTISGYKPKDVIGKSPAVFMNKNSIKNDISKLNLAIRNKKEFKFDTLNIKKLVKNIG